MPSIFSRFDWSNLQNLGLLGLAGWIFDIPYLPWLMLFFLFGLLPLIRQLREAEQADDLPRGATWSFYSSYFLSMLNPLVFVPAMIQSFGQLYIWLRSWRGLPAPDTYRNCCTYRLPFRGQWLVANGGTRRDNSHSWEVLTQRYAYDFVKVDARGQTHAGAGDHLSHYYCYEAEVLAPAAGTVVRVKNGVRDYQGVGDHTLDWKTTDFRGNHVVIRHGKGEYSFIAHFRQGSIRVRKGEQVESGQCIGLCGNSGHSTEPHIHVHVQSGPVMWFSRGLPVRFFAFEKDGVACASGYLEKGEQVRPTDAHA